MKTTICGFIACAVLAAVPRLSSAAVIDDFSQGPMTIQATNVAGQTIYQTGLNAAAVLGGARSVYIGSLAQASGIVDTSVSEFRFHSEASFGYFTLTEGGIVPSSGIDLTADGGDAFAIGITRISFKPFRGIYQFEVKADDTWHAFNLLNDLAKLDGSGIVTVPFSNFAGVDMRHIQGVRIDVARFEPGSEIAIGSILTVPEPSAQGLCFGAMVILGWMRKSRMF